MIGAAALPCPRQQSGGDGDDQRDDRAVEQQHKRRHHAVEDKLGNRLPIIVGDAEVALPKVLEIDQVLDADAAIEPEPRPHRRHQRRGCVDAEDGAGRIAGDEANEQKHRERNPEGDGNHQQQTADDVVQHAPGFRKQTKVFWFFFSKKNVFLEKEAKTFILFYRLQLFHTSSSQ